MTLEDAMAQFKSAKAAVVAETPKMVDAQKALDKSITYAQYGINDDIVKLHQKAVADVVSSQTARDAEFDKMQALYSAQFAAKSALDQAVALENQNAGAIEINSPTNA